MFRAHVLIIRRSQLHYTASDIITLKQVSGLKLLKYNSIDMSKLTYLLTYSMVQSPSCAANWLAASQEIPRISRNPKVHYRTHKRTPPISILGQPNPVHIPTSHLLEIHPNIIHPSTPRSPQWSLSTRFPQHDTLNHPLPKDPRLCLTSGPFPPLSPPRTDTLAFPRRSILILHTHLRLGIPSGLFLTSFPTKTLYTALYPQIHQNIFHSSTPRSLQWSLSLRFPHQDSIHLLSSPICATCPAHLILLD